MDTKLERYFLESAATDNFRRICLLRHNVGEGLTMTFAEILEEEARARCANLLREQIEVRKEQSDISERLERSALLIKSKKKPDELII